MVCLGSCFSAASASSLGLPRQARQAVPNRQFEFLNPAGLERIKPSPSLDLAQQRIEPLMAFEQTEDLVWHGEMLLIVTLLSFDRICRVQVQTGEAESRT